MMNSPIYRLVTLAIRTAQAKIDLSTYRQVPWDDKTPFFCGDFEDGPGRP